MGMQRSEAGWEVVIEAELRSPEEHVGQAEDRLMNAVERLGAGASTVVGGGPEGHIAVRVIVSGESFRVALERAAALFQEAVALADLQVGEPHAVDVSMVGSDTPRVLS